MKPRLMKYLGLWLCGIKGRKTTGVGYTMTQAYDDWLARELMT